jgi:hypothetical protein
MAIFNDIISYHFYCFTKIMKYISDFLVVTCGGCHVTQWVGYYSHNLMLCITEPERHYGIIYNLEIDFHYGT